MEDAIKALLFSFDLLNTKTHQEPAVLGHGIFLQEGAKDFSGFIELPVSNESGSLLDQMIALW